MEVERSEPFVVSARLLSGRVHEVDLAPHGGPLTLVDEAKALIGQRESIPPEHLRLIFGGKQLLGHRPLGYYGIGHRAVLHVVVHLAMDPFFPTARMPTPDEPTELDWAGPRPPGVKLRNWTDVQELHARSKDHSLPIHVWRVGQGFQWVEIIIEGPPGTFYEGGDFLLRVDYYANVPFRCYKLRMHTPIYHPTIGPAGIVAMLGFDPTRDWDPKTTLSQVIERVVNQLGTYNFSYIEGHTLRQEIVQLDSLLQEWEKEGLEFVRRKARIWTWHYATAHGRRYHRDQGYCSSVPQLGSLMSVDSKVHAEIRTALLIAQRSAHSAEAPPQSDRTTAQGSFLGILPRELLHAILMYIGSQRWPPPQPALRWELVNGGDDGLPLNWRRQLSVHDFPT